MAVCVVLTAVRDVRVGSVLAQSLVSKKLAACVTVLPGAVSYYRWKGKREKSREALLLIKTTRKHWSALEVFLKEHHPYQLPEILMLPASKGSKEYVSWLNRSLKK